ncbi:MAG: SGNH/GDSL hydrolase family protein [Myxococcaceae bacterium]|nr:SGNH/GDSL hydrolase family protein [Myxococcaceae bacterium]
MRSSSALWILAWCWTLLGACGPGSSEPAGPLEGQPELTAPTTPEETDPVPPSEPPPPPVAPEPEVVPPPPAPVFQPAFHQALRWSQRVGGLTTFHLRVPVGRAGARLRITLRSGDGKLTLQKATVTRVGADGVLSSQPVPLTFSGSAGFSVGARTLVTSDPLLFPVGFREELIISFEVKGALAASAIDAFPGSFMRSGAHASATGALSGEPWERAIGLASIDVEAAPGRAFVALGDSITEGYISTYNDTRDAWPSLVEKELGVPVVNAAVSGQGFYETLEYLDQEVLAISGATDCLILLGTNDLAGDSVGKLQARMTTLLDRLKPFCRTWVSTLLPKEKANHDAYEQVKRDRLEFNAWLRQQTQAELIDLEAVTRSPTDTHLFIDGLEVDGIHPSAEGHRVMAAEVVRVLREKGL